MTKVTLHYELVRPLAEADGDAIARVHGVYGIVRAMPRAAMDRITVDYDASRLSEKDVEAALIGAGVPIRRAVAIRS